MEEQRPAYLWSLLGGCLADVHRTDSFIEMTPVNSVFTGSSSMPIDVQTNDAFTLPDHVNEKFCKLNFIFYLIISCKLKEQKEMKMNGEKEEQ